MSFAQQNIVGIDIGTERIKMVKARKGAASLRAVSAIVPEGVIKQSKIESKELLTDAIKALKKSGHIRNSDCALCISSQDTIIRHFSLPRMNEKQIYQNVVDEISGYLPVNTDRFNIDYRIQEVIGAGDETKYKVMVVAVPREIVAGYIECLHKAGLNVKYVDVAENGYEKIMRYLHAKGSSADVKNYSIIDLGATKTTVSVYKDDNFFVNHLINTGSNQLVQSICEKTALDRKAVEKLLSKPDIFDSTEKPDDISPFIKKYLDNTLQDARKVFDFYRNRNNQGSIGAAYLVGGLSLLTGVTGYISTQLGLPVDTLAKMTGFMFKDNTAQPGSTDFSGAIGVTFREVNKT